MKAVPDLPIKCPVRSTERGMEYLILGNWFPDFRVQHFLANRYVAKNGCHISTLPKWSGKDYTCLAFRLNGIKINARAHRVAYELFVGPTTETLLVCHTCDNPPCLHPAHLYEGTQQRNVDDRTERGRSRSEGIDKLGLVKEYLEEGYTKYDIDRKLGMSLGYTSNLLARYKLESR